MMNKFPFREYFKLERLHNENHFVFIEMWHYSTSGVCSWYFKQSLFNLKKS